MRSPLSFRDLALPGVTLRPDGSWIGDPAALASYRVAGSIFFFPHSSRIERGEDGQFRLAELAVLAKDIAKGQTGPFPVRALNARESIVLTPFSDTDGDGKPDPVLIREDGPSEGGFTTEDREMLTALYQALVKPPSREVSRERRSASRSSRPDPLPFR